ncbi:hypothetical protein BLS_001985 [Venturia inaequalis]|uniref:D-xylulose reductase n=2 Tax=Venturia inaequalis TaxID=5025 RepID=A0A8H3Z3L8_VENIN|nr:hypothetical protein BLS_001985 [Venturia inaequalis]
MKNNPSFILHEPYKVTFEDRPVPQILDPHDVIVEVRFTGICGSDVHYWTHGRIGTYILTTPMVLGHESAGTIHSIGPSVTSLKRGDRVAMEPGIPCRRCKRCLSGHYNLCPQMAFAATPPYDGTLARYYRLPEDFCYKLADGMSLEEGALVEPAAVAVHVCKQASVKPGDNVLVFGAGPVGLLCCAVSRAFGARKVVSVDVNEERLVFAKGYAATHVYRSQRVGPEENARMLVEEAGLGEGADVVIDATGAEGAADITFPIMAMCAKELNVKGSFRYGSGDYALAVDLIESGRLNVKELISRKVKFEDAEEAFKDVKAGKGIKILIEGPSG